MTKARYLPLIFLSIFLMGQEDCDPQPPPPTPALYCAGAHMQAEPAAEPELGTIEAFLAVVREGIESAWQSAINTIVGGTPSDNKNSTMFLYSLGSGSCTATQLTPHTALTAAHCKGNSGHRLYLNIEDYLERRNDPDSYWEATDLLEHEEYAQFRRDPSNLEARKSDLMLLYFEKELPGPFPLGIYQEERVSPLCNNLLAQGYGKTEAVEDILYPCPDGKERCLRESDYTVTNVEEKVIRTKQATWGGICFGDSGGPLYAQVGEDPGLYLAGVTSTTASLDCLVGSTHVKVEHFIPWIDRFKRN